ncbi:exodeoxyribonuclease 7 small subunit [Andreesenia angusta]|uniref:Exodeoxyribonuclease 7 small subunit n=1 Tax=Andreesenia angusta TaxID=39480 RepID=A0A1S1V8R4_9FIRM|nr:exodeoxyribonuclease VII small subunit [Andreesenia angusta]OHW62986.1 exodeoxyribonuclease 7 small subunit [Andreesenia angusta]
MKKKDPKFEDYLKELEKVVEKLENGNVSLEKSLEEFQNGIELYRKCSDILKEVEGKISVLEEKEIELNIEDIQE